MKKSFINYCLTTKIKNPPYLKIAYMVFGIIVLILGMFFRYYPDLIGELWIYGMGLVIGGLCVLFVLSSRFLVSSYNDYLKNNERWYKVKVV